MIPSCVSDEVEDDESAARPRAANSSPGAQEPRVLLPVRYFGPLRALLELLSSPDDKPDEVLTGIRVPFRAHVS